MADTDLRAEMETLRQDLAAIRDDLARLRQAGNDAASEAVGTARERLEKETERLMERLKSAAEQAEDRGMRVLHDVEQQIEERPLTTLLSSFGLGVIVGWLFSRK